MNPFGPAPDQDESTNLYKDAPIGKVRATNGQREEALVFQYRRTATLEARLICELLGLAVMRGIQSIARTPWVEMFAYKANSKLGA